MADDYRQKLAPTSVSSPARTDGWVGAPGWPARLHRPAALLAGIGQAQAGNAFRGYVSLGPRLFLVTSEPMRFGEEVLGTLTAAYVRDDAAALELARMTGCAVNFVFDGRLCGTSLQGERKAALKRSSSRRRSPPADRRQARPARARRRALRHRAPIR